MQDFIKFLDLEDQAERSEEKIESLMIAKAQSFMRAKKNPMHAAIFGSGFNPTTMGHADFITVLLRDFSQVCLIPSACSPLKTLENYALAADRVAILKLVLQARFDAASLQRLRIETIELDRPPPSRMIITLAALILIHQAEWSYTIACGYDHLEQMDRWYRWRDFKGLATLRFYPRQGVFICQERTVDVLHALLKAEISVSIVFVDEQAKTEFYTYCSQKIEPRWLQSLGLICDGTAVITACSSTAIRAFYHQRMGALAVDVPPGLTSAAHAYILEHGCYSVC